MSAFICSHSHFSTIVRFAGRHNVTTYHGNPSRHWYVAGQEQETVDLLFAENVKSFNYRYNEAFPTTGIVYDPFAPDLQPIEVIKACNCLDYQSCEHPQWVVSLACKLLHDIQQQAITLLPGYDKARWKIPA